MPSDFEKKVWAAIDKIPEGSVLTYKELANKIGHPNSARAVANACGKNPFLLKHLVTESLDQMASQEAIVLLAALIKK